MTTLRSIVLSSVLLVACNPDAPAQPKVASEAAPADAAAKAPGTLPKKRLPPGDPHAEPLPGEDPAPTQEVMPATKGTFDLERDGKVVHFTRLSPGQNRAIVLPDGKTGRVSLGASESAEGHPHMRIVIDGLRLDQATYPITIDSSPEKAAPQKDATPSPSLTVRYEVSDLRVYVLDPAKGANMQVTLEAFEGSTLRGKLEGKLAPTAAGLGDPIPVSGKFAIELGLQGVQPGPTVPAP